MSSLLYPTRFLFLKAWPKVAVVVVFFLMIELDAKFIWTLLSFAEQLLSWNQDYNIILNILPAQRLLACFNEIMKKTK